jgi:hypothetical protein
MVLISLRKVSASETMMEEGYIVVYQDVRGRWMSDLYDNMRAYIPNKKSKRMLMKLQIRMILLIGWLIQTITMGMLEFGEFHTPVLCYLFFIKQASCTESRFASGVYQ